MTSNKKTSQKALILAHMLSYSQPSNQYRSISHIEAQALYRVMSLSRRICDLKQDGWEINKEAKRDVTGVKYVRYSIKGLI